MPREYTTPEEHSPTNEAPVSGAEQALPYALIGRTLSTGMAGEARQHLMQKYQLESSITVALNGGGIFVDSNIADGSLHTAIALDVTPPEGQPLQLSVRKNVAGNRAISIRNRLGWLAEVHYMISGDPLITSRYGEADTEPVETFASTSDMQTVSELLRQAQPAQVTATDLVRDDPAVTDRFTIADDRISPEHGARLAMIEVGRAIVSLAFSKSRADSGITPHSATLQGTTERSASDTQPDEITMKYWATVSSNATATAIPVDINTTVAVSEQTGGSLRRQVLSVSTDNGRLIKQLFTEEGGLYGPVSTTTDTPVLASQSFGRALRNFLRDPRTA